ncbi:YetF domain-containing protein [Halobacillus mangrovi]|uniref:YetF domain-containing protein n=1 Tax=Halobacillus mangrovi TaxID=402384 RepID=UPI003D9527E2
MNQLAEVFQSTEDLSLGGFALRTIVSVLMIYFMSRFLLKRAAGQFTAFDFVFLWMLGALAVAPLLDGKILFSTTVLATATLYFWHFVVAWLSVRSSRFASLIRREPTVLVKKGKLNVKNMKKTFFNTDLLLAEMRLAEAPDLKEVDEVILESSGHLSIVKKSGHTPPTPSDFQIPVPPGGVPTILINNGRIDQANLKKLDLTEEWLMTQLNQKGVPNIKATYLATISPDGEFYYSVK